MDFLFVGWVVDEVGKWWVGLFFLVALCNPLGSLLYTSGILSGLQWFLLMWLIDCLLRIIKKNIYSAYQIHIVKVSSTEFNTQFKLTIRPLVH